MPSRHASPVGLRLSNGGNHGHRELRRMNHQPDALNTLFKYARAPHSLRDTPDNSSSVINDTVEPDACVQDSIWPPDGLHARSYLTSEDAPPLISQGVLHFKGVGSQAHHTSQPNTRCFAFAGVIDKDGSSSLSSRSRKLSQGCSLVLGGYVDEDRPWDTLEQPSMTMCFGDIPGSISLNRYVGRTSRPVNNEEPKSLIERREMSMRDILDRLACVQHGLDVDSVLAQEYLYHTLVFDRDAQLSGQPKIERQIQVLTEALDSPRWIDFRRAQDQTIASYFCSDDLTLARIFYHQLMLSMQLLLDICKTRFSRKFQAYLFNALPEKVAWSVALAQLWREHCWLTKPPNRQEDPVLGPYAVTFRSMHDRVERLIDFGRALKWPRMKYVENHFEDDHYGTVLLEKRSKEAMTWLSGLTMPGDCSSWFIMTALLDFDKHYTRSLKNFTLFVPNFGFQYRDSSYWYWECIVAKVMAAAGGVHQVEGWVGPVSYSVSLTGIQCVAINQYASPHAHTRSDVSTIEVRSDPLGPAADYYPVSNFSFPRLESEPITTIRFRRLEFKRRDNVQNPVYDSCVIFAITGSDPHRIPVRLRYNVSFVAAPSCNSGPHVLCNEYAYQTAPVDQIWRLNFWGGCCVCPLDRKGPKCKHRAKYSKLFDEESVMVIRAFGSAVNDVFARAWCSYMGLSAVIAESKKTCVACAIRNAYAACIAVIIMIDGKDREVTGTQI